MSTGWRGRGRHSQQRHCVMQAVWRDPTTTASTSHRDLPLVLAPPEVLALILGLPLQLLLDPEVGHAQTILWASRRCKQRWSPLLGGQQTRPALPRALNLRSYVSNATNCSYPPLPALRTSSLMVGSQPSFSRISLLSLLRPRTP